MSYHEAIQFLYGLRLFGAKFGLENTRHLAAMTCNPQNQLRFIHVAGTNGKGSTCAMLESIYRTAGLRVGLFTSPHLVSFRERIQVNRKLIEEADVVRLLAALQPLLKQFPADHHPTFFEVVTVMALLHFTEQKCDLVLWETGLGGRLDATNIVTPLAAVITNVQYDHQEWLGDTIAKIAAEKAGIIKPGVPVVTAAEDPEALTVIEEAANRLGAPLTYVTSEHASRITHHASLTLLGDHQRTNAALAAKTVEVLQPQIPVTAADVGRGLETVSWPGRLQLVTRASGQRICLDGAHNVGGAISLRSVLEQRWAGQPWTLILGVLGDKDWGRVCEILAPIAARILTVPVSTERSAEAQKLAEACRVMNPACNARACGSLKEALECSVEDEMVVITGSIYLVGEAFGLLGLSSAGDGEMALNDWTSSPTAGFGR